MKRIYISNLDMRILCFVSNMKFSDSKMISLCFFKGKGERYPKKRLKDFVDNGLLYTLLSWGGRMPLYLITEKGAKLLERNGFDVVSSGVKGLDLKNYEHDLFLSHLRIHLEGEGLVDNWISERLLRFRGQYLFLPSGDKIIPDAYCRSVKHDKQLVIEFENTRKSNDRIRKLLESYQLLSISASDMEILFFFSNEQTLLKYKETYIQNNLSFPVKFLSTDFSREVLPKREHRRNLYV
jgi:hypothetical protein